MKTNYVGYIKRRIARGKWITSLNLYPNQIEKLVEKGFSVVEEKRKKATHKNQKIWCKVSCKEAKKGTYAHRLYSKAKSKKGMHQKKIEKDLFLKNTELHEKSRNV